jgi:hypothetical protein
MQNYLIFNTIASLIKKNQFLPVDDNTSSDFGGTDTKKLLEKNLKTQTSNWEYRNKPVRYTINSRGYRTAEFKNIDWANSIVIFGCSNVFGVGLDDEDTISSQLEKITGIPLVNLGASGSSMTYSLHNSIILKDGYPTPKAVVHIWTDYHRTVYYRRNRIESHGSWNLEKNNYMDVWSNSNHHSATHGLMASITSKHLWSNTSYYEASFWNETANSINCDYLKTEDYARDLIHPGIKTARNTAIKIADNLKCKQ